MDDELNKALGEYFTKWQKLISITTNRDFLKQQKPTAVAWKVTDLTELLAYFEQLRDDCDQIHWGWVNGRWLVTMHLRDTKLEGAIEIIKLMQRRPGSTDAIGLDHLDFYSLQNLTAEQLLSQEPKLTWTKESNGSVCSWLSIWFADTEAKLRSDTVLDPCIAELQAVNQTILGSSL